jgi:L-fuconolactonase
MERIDAHHHLWHYNAADYGWINDEMAALRRDFLVDELTRELATAHVDGTIVVQARQTLEETSGLLALADQTPEIRAVTGWAPIAADDFAAQLDALRIHPRLRALRHVVQAEPDGFLDSPDFNRGMRALTPTGLIYEILIVARQLDAAIRFVDRHPKQSFVLDHIAKPPIAAARNEPDHFVHWRAGLRRLAERPNVACKLSGMVTEAGWPADRGKDWTTEAVHAGPRALTPYFEAALEAFGPSRLMIGTDWPVLTVACTYSEWWRAVERWVEPLTREEQAGILGGTATNIYNL